MPRGFAQPHCREGVGAAPAGAAPTCGYKSQRLLRAVRAVVLDESAGRLILRIQGLGRALDSGEDLLGQDLAQLDAPLVEGIDAPHSTLHEGDVLVQGDQLAQDRGGQGRGHDRTSWDGCR